MTKRRNEPQSLQPGTIEYEMGVPVPGVILPVEQWVPTAIHRLPEGPWDFEAIFGRKSPIVLDIGCGNGRFVIGSAIRRPEMDHVGIDILPVVIRYATRRGKQRGLSNTRFAVCGGSEFLERHVKVESIREIHIYHPQPFHDPQESHRRLLTPEFFRNVYRALEPEGQFILQTDSREYWEYAVSCLQTLLNWHEQTGPWDGDPYGRSRREAFAKEKGLQIYRGYGIRGSSFSEEELEEKTRTMALPIFSTPKSDRRRGRPHRRHR